MKKKLVEYVKKNTYIFRLYNIIFGTMIKIAKKFIKEDEKLILFSSFGGKNCSDSPLEIYKAMRSDDRFNEYKLMWALSEPDKYKDINAVKIDTIKYYYFALKARVWITNSSMERGLSFKGTRTFYINTWHGSPLKKMGIDINKKNVKTKEKNKSPLYDIFCVQSDYESEIFKRAFSLNNYVIKKTGIPRNDKLLNINKCEIAKIKDELGVKNEKVILYAPTFRDFGVDVNIFNFNVQLDLKKWNEELGEDKILLIRNHYEVQTNIESKYENIIDVSSYPSTTDLLLISDLLITDYSSIMFDYSILRRPIICYAYDLERYEKERGLYIDLQNLFKKIYFDEYELLSDVVNSNYTSYASNKIFTSYIDYYGNATNNVIAEISQELKI